MKIHVDTKQMKLFECLSSSTRIRVLEILEHGGKNIGELAAMLGVSSSIMTRHILMLEEAGLVHTESIPGKRGMQKKCCLSTDEITLSFKSDAVSYNYSTVSIPIGQYADYQVSPTCGLASTEKIIGVWDDPRYFSDPSRVNASILWYGSGWIEYRIPSYMTFSQPISSIEISMEICSEFPGYNENWPSDIYFYLNGLLLGMWRCPGDFGAKKGIYTPEWWGDRSQYGLLKTISITNQGAMLDGIKLSNVSIDTIPLQEGRDLAFKIVSPKDTRNPGGISLFGRGFGNYDQDIEVRVIYE